MQVAESRDAIDAPRLAQFESQGFAICEGIIDPEQCNATLREIDARDANAIGSRNLLESSWCAEVSRALRNHPDLAELMPSSMMAVQCTFFEKAIDKNWLVALHQDLSIPVASRVECPELSGWSLKEGGWYVQPPPTILEQLIAVRLHLDNCGVDDGPLRVVAGTHREGRLSGELAIERRRCIGETICHIDVGGVLVMRPLLLHASSKSSSNSRRRVLHFVFGPVELPYGLSWRTAI